MIPLHKIAGRLGNQLFQFAYLYCQAKEGVTPDFFVQDFKYFEKHENELKTLLGEGIGYLSTVAIHIRRGDYINNPFYVDLTKTDYYQKAMELFPHATFLVFSDDIDFAKDYLKQFDRTFAYSEGNDEVTDLNLMASCSSQIIANSSFSYWAGILNQNPAKKVVYPSEWFTDKINRVGFPTTWTRI